MPDSHDPSRRTLRREPRLPEPRLSEPLLQRSLPTPLATLGQLGGLGFIAYLLWNFVTKVFSFITAHLVGTGVFSLVVIFLLVIGVLIKRYREQMEKMREEEEERKAEAIQALRDQGYDEKAIKSMLAVLSSSDRPSRRRPGSRRRGDHV